jgi:hypothetical protein
LVSVAAGPVLRKIANALEKPNNPHQGFVAGRRDPGNAQKRG